MKQTLKQALRIFCPTLTWLPQRRMRSREQLGRLELSCLIIVSHGTIVQLSLSLRFGCYGKVPCYKTRETANKSLCKCSENNRLKCVFCNSKLGYLATYGAISTVVTSFGLAKSTVLNPRGS